jgi:hypothetical protein
MSTSHQNSDHPSRYFIIFLIAIFYPEIIRRVHIEWQTIFVKDVLATLFRYLTNEIIKIYHVLFSGEIAFDTFTSDWSRERFSILRICKCPDSTAEIIEH